MLKLDNYSNDVVRCLEGQKSNSVKSAFVLHNGGDENKSDWEKGRDCECDRLLKARKSRNTQDA